MSCLTEGTDKVRSSSILQSYENEGDRNTTVTVCFKEVRVWHTKQLEFHHKQQSYDCYDITNLYGIQ